MAVVATETQRRSNLVKSELFPEIAYCRAEVTYNGAAKSFAIGDLITNVGGVPAAVANIYGVVITDVSAPLNTATKVQVLFRGPAALSTGGINVGALVAADVYTALEGKGFKVLTAA